MDKQEEEIRINKFLSEAGVCSRREGDRMLSEGRILIDGAVAKPGDKVTKGQRVFVDGKEVKKEIEEIFLAFYKPRGLVCTTARKENGEKIKNVIDYIGYPKRIYPVGRLDQASEGLLLLTNQGEEMDRILRSRNEHEKEYFVQVDHRLTEEFLEGMRRGVPILDTVTKPCKVWKESEKSFHIIITQGLNRQIRRMCEYFGYRVTFLRRDRVMNITLQGLEKGKYRHLTEDEVAELKEILYRKPNLKKQNHQRQENREQGLNKQSHQSLRSREQRADKQRYQKQNLKSPGNAKQSRQKTNHNHDRNREAKGAWKQKSRESKS